MPISDPVPFLDILQLLRTATDLNKLMWESTPDPFDFRAPFASGHVWFQKWLALDNRALSPDAVRGIFTITFKDRNGESLNRY
jgi:hypothetical protein